ncbi:DUF4064 domain-containing protein [Terribacillus saccharophilus]|uniref:DUF4064 domain-containing protein n=1 Tax=Terribacillus saccharophilus TaxID=361277 RepID=UPI0039827EAC
MKIPRILTLISLTLLILTFIGSLLFTLTLPQNQTMKQAVTHFLENDPKYQRTLAAGENPAASVEEMAADTMPALQVLFTIPTVYIAIICLIVWIGFLIMKRNPKGAAMILSSAAVLSLAAVVIPILLFLAGGKLRKQSV